MGRRKLSTEERMKKQKERLMSSKNEVKTENTYKPSVNQKVLICEEAQRKGYDVKLVDSVLLFNHTDEVKTEEITKWLLNKYGVEETVKSPVDGKPVKVKTLPFSYGFGNYGHSRQSEMILNNDSDISDDFDDR